MRQASKYKLGFECDMNDKTLTDSLLAGTVTSFLVNTDYTISSKKGM